MGRLTPSVRIHASTGMAHRVRSGGITQILRQCLYQIISHGINGYEELI